jgi:hypothetical protein
MKIEFGECTGETIRFSMVATCDKDRIALNRIYGRGNATRQLCFTHYVQCPGIPNAPNEVGFASVKRKKVSDICPTKEVMPTEAAVIDRLLND